MSRLANQRVVVVGGSSGIGLAIAKEAAALGASLVVASRSAEKLRTAAAAIDGDVAIAAFDMLDAAAVARSLDMFAAIDHLVLTAIDREYSLFDDVSSVTSEQVERSFDKLRGFINVIRAARPKLAPRATLTLLSGAGAVKPPKGSSLAAAANGAIVSFGKALAVELAPIRVNTLMPGPVETSLHGDNLSQVRAWAETLPAKHFGQPQDIAQAALLLMTNPYITGHTLVIDGGYLLQ